MAIAIEWAARAMEELFAQGDLEAELGLPISPFMDRKQVTPKPSPAPSPSPSPEPEPEP